MYLSASAGRVGECVKPTNLSKGPSPWLDLVYGVLYGV
jgi:hypothetical protein